MKLNSKRIYDILTEYGYIKYRQHIFIKNNIKIYVGEYGSLGYICSVDDINGNTYISKTETRLIEVLIHLNRDNQLRKLLT